MDNHKKGILFGIICVILVGLEPIIANSRPSELDAFIFAAMTVIIEAILFFPIMLVERKKIKSKHELNVISTEEMESLLYGYKNNRLLLLYIGITFGIAQILFFIAYTLSGAINGSLSQKTTIIWALLFGFLINHEKITKTQIFFSGLLLVGLIIAVTQGSFDLLELNLGVILMLITTMVWMLAHAFTKPVFDRKESTPIQMVFIRNAIGGIILISIYFLIFPIKNIELFLKPINILFFILMGIDYGISLYCWYKVLTYLGTSKGTAMVSGTPLITIVFAVILLGESFTIFHLIGTSIVIISIIMIVLPKKTEKKVDS